MSSRRPSSSRSRSRSRRGRQDWGLSLSFLLCLLSCAPDTDLVGEGGGGADAGMGSTTGGASLVDPAAGAAGVPLNLAAVLVRFPVAVTLPDGAFSIAAGDLRPALAAPLPVDCPTTGSAPAGACFRVELVDLLAPSATYVVSMGQGVVAASGASVAAGVVGQFVTAAEADLRAPAIAGMTVEPSGPCVRVTLQTDEPSSVVVLLRGPGAERVVSAGAGTTQFAVSASIAAFAAGSDVEVVARAVDPAGNVAESAGVAVSVPVGLLPLAITEVLANAAGPEPAQEYVEIRNLGADPLELEGLSIEDAKAADVLAPTVLAPGAYALIVPAGFDPASAADTPPRPGTSLVRVDARIGADGMTNSGELVRLRTPAGTILSSYGGSVDVSSSKWAGKGVHRVPEDACDQPASWTRLPTEATPGWGAP